MKTKRKPNYSALDGELFNLFREVCNDEAECRAAVQNAKRAFSFFKQDALYRNSFNEENL